MPSNLFTPIQVPGLTIPGNIFLAPLAGYTDKAFREICLQHGASLVYTEMVSAEAIARENKKSLQLLERGPEEDLLAMQIFLSQAEQADRALPRLLEYSPSLIDINCGCPVPKVVKTGAGAALMRNPRFIYDIVKTLTQSTDIPVTVKIRSGWDQSELNYLEAAHAAEEAGASMIGIHPRTRAQGYSGTSNWEHIAELVNALEIPVIGSGDLFSAEAAADMLSQTGCRAVMFARGAIGNPFIFSETRRLLEPQSDKEAGAEREASESGQNHERSRKEHFARLEIAYHHLLRSISFKGERLGCKEMKKHFGAYTKGYPGGSALRNELMRCGSLSEYRDVLQGYFEAHGMQAPFSPSET